MNEKTGGNPAAAFSPKLKMAAAQIQKILRENDIAGVVHLFEPGFNEWAMHISPSFSCVALNETHQLRINPPLEVPDHPEIHKKKIADTVNMLANLRLHTGKLSLTFTQAEMTVRAHFNIAAPKPAPGGPKIVPPNNFINGKKRHK